MSEIISEEIDFIFDPNQEDDILDDFAQFSALIFALKHDIVKSIATRASIMENIIAPEADKSKHSKKYKQAVSQLDRIDYSLELTEMHLRNIFMQVQSFEEYKKYEEQRTQILNMLMDLQLTTGLDIMPINVLSPIQPKSLENNDFNNQN